MAEEIKRNSRKRRNLKAKKAANRDCLDSCKNKLALFCGIGGKYSSLELLITASAKLDYIVKGDVHPHKQIKHLCKILDNSAVKKKNMCRTKKDFYSSRAWKILRYQAFEKYGNRCQCCGARPNDDVTLHVDHVKPRSKNPELALDLNNLQILCEWCNIGKINQWETDWRA